jgi:tetratricopeptide (TPR) repeat protein
MIEATCSACGTLNRVPEANVPVGAKFITCAGCKARVAIPGAAPSAPATGKSPPPMPRSPLAVPPPAKSADVIDLADLPAPRRVPAPALKPSRTTGQIPIPALDLDDLPPSAAPAAALDDGSIDLPAPKRAAPRPPPTEPTRDTVSDLPAPKASRGVSDLPTPKLGAKRTIADLPAVRDAAAHPASLPDLPAPKRGPMIPDLPAPRTDAPARNTELPAPQGFFDDLPQPPSDAGPDLLAPKGFFDDLPQPALDRGPDLLAPKGFFDDLPQPAANRGTDLPAPKGFFDDLPQPAPHRGADLPAPKGFFDDIPGLPNASQPEVPAPKGYFENIPALPSTSKPEVPAPKGYFENIPGRPNVNKPEVPAPKGYFENIPGLPHVSKPEVPAPKGFFENIPGLPHVSKPEVPAPKGFFDDIPGRPLAKPDEVAPRGFFDDLPQPGAAAPAARPAGARAHPPSEELELQPGPELELITPSEGGAGSFDELDLSKPSAPAMRLDPGHGARFQAPRAAGATSPPRSAGLELEVEGPASGAVTRLVSRPPAPAPPVLDTATLATARTQRNKRVLGGVLAVAVLGGGGGLLYQRHAAAVSRDAEIAAQLAIARTAYAAGDAKHWQRAATAARQVIELDAGNPEALGIGAEALLASAISDGTAATANLGQAHAMLDAANSGGITSPQLARARALSALAAHQADGAILQLQPLVNQAPRDAALALYLGWALDARGDHEAAIKAYDAALAGPSVKLAALYGRGNAKLELADLEGARGDFSAALELAKDHIGAQVGLAAAEPPSAAEQQEADLLAILARKDIATADPRAVALAWSRAGDAARRAGRYDVARERYRKALAVVPQDLAATTGLADTELRDGKVAAAAELIATALNLSKDNVPAQLVQSEIEVTQHKLPLAAQRLAALAAHPTPLAPAEQARLGLVTGRLLEAQGKDDEAVDAYVQGAKAARDLDLAPMMAAVDKLATMITRAEAARDATRAGALRERSEQLLGELAEQAGRDPRLALRLGLAYLQGGNAEKAEPWLRRAAAARPNDAEAQFQLGRALLKAGKTDDALAALSTALAAGPERADIGVTLARAYEVLGRDADAGAIYTRLLAAKDPGLELRGRAGRFYARTGALAKAGEQGARIVDADPGNAAGLYLKGEGLLAGGKPLEAKQTFQRAVEIDRDPQYLDALGRAAEALWQGSGDRELQDLALRSYLAATEAAPTMFNPVAGAGRLYVARHEAAKAVAPLLAAARLEPQNAMVMALAGAAYQELQQSATALRWLEASVQREPSANAYWRIGQLYRDANQGPKAASALASAARLAADAEKRTGKPVPWLTDALYLQGRVNLDLHDETTAREAWSLYVARNPPASAQLTEVKQLLATSLRR